jgi:hypothetical protein
MVVAAQGRVLKMYKKLLVSAFVFATISAGSVFAAPAAYREPLDAATLNTCEDESLFNASIGYVSHESLLHVFPDILEEFTVAPSPRDRSVFPARKCTCWAIRAKKRNVHHLAGAILDRLSARIPAEVRLGEPWRDEVDLYSGRL